MYQNLRHCLSPDQQEDSVHYLSFPSASEIHQPTPDIEEAMSCMRVVVELGRTIRERKKLPLKMPLNKLLVLHKSPKFLENLSNSLAYVKSVCYMLYFTCMFCIHFNYIYRNLMYKKWRCYQKLQNLFSLLLSLTVSA